MSQWTQKASDAWRQYVQEVRDRLRATQDESDAQEVVDDLRRHVEAELASAGSQVVTEEELKRVLARIGMPESDTETSVVAHAPPSVTAPVVVSPNHATDHTAKRQAKTKRRWWWPWQTLILFFGVLLPLAAPLFEAATGLCANIFFDPTPTIWHLLLFLLIPAANFTAWLITTQGSPRYRSQAGLFNALGMGVALVYTLLFLPLLPFSVIGIIFLGIGFFGLAPLSGFIAALMLRRRLRFLTPEGQGQRVPGLWVGLAVAVLAMALVEMPSTVTRLGLEMAASDNPATQSRGLTMLRTVGSNDWLLKACYERPRAATDLLGFVLAFSDPVQPTQARGIYYRVTGQPFNSVPPPRLSVGRRWEGFESSWDEDQGGVNVGTQRRGLSLVTSQMDASLDGNAALGYIEWTLVFRNDHAMVDHEARAQVLLPAGGVVSRLTLWVDGEEREAAFASRGQTRQAYENIVRQQRDPVLVTTAGPDRVLVQCFPVLRGGKEMKVRLGITAPMSVLAADDAALRLPVIVERNFTLSPTTAHHIWVEAKQPLTATDTALTAEAAPGGVFALRGQISDVQLLDATQAVVHAARLPEVTTSWTPDPLKGSDAVIVQKLEHQPATRPKRVVVVVDGSSEMSPVFAEVAQAFSVLPEGVELVLLAAGDSVVDLLGGTMPIDAAVRNRATDALRNYKPIGGADNAPALTEAWNRASNLPEGQAVILWIHGSQPVELTSISAVAQHWQRRVSGPRLIEVPATPGINRIIEGFDPIAHTALTQLPRTAALHVDLERLFAQWHGVEPIWVMQRNKAKASDAIPGTPSAEVHRTSAHLARLWALEEVNRLRRERVQGNDKRAISLAASYQLVTPVTGAVVLETAQQFAAAGLTPVDAATVPTVPEPEVWAMLIIVAFILMVLLWRRQRSRTWLPTTVDPR